MSRFLQVAKIKPATLTITTAGTAQNPVSTPIPDGVNVVFLAHKDNTGFIKIADSAANAQSAAGTNNVPLAANQSVSFQITDPTNVFIDATVSGEKVIIVSEF